MNQSDKYHFNPFYHLTFTIPILPEVYLRKKNHAPLMALTLLYTEGFNAMVSFDGGGKMVYL